MATHDELPNALTKSPSFQIERVRRHTKEEVERTLFKHDVSMRGFWVLTCVDNTALSQSQLSSLLAVDASDMVRLVDSLENLGWVKRDRDPKDRRRQIVTATKKGSKALGTLAEEVADAEDRALDASSAKQLKSLKKLSKAILQDEDQ
ncbi:MULTISPECIES: MarR family transcriptional regulator [Corynebacterium]|uniref:MarR family transcriptional regulator n=2 Tax=Corynebacterium TaxID=1716 RepID=A0AB36RP52_9CORY|nr:MULTISPECIES: MarR family transcriptional regulator [Corynebacterium]MCG7253299.1 winged helix DNA-binding protein [Corynebacterium hadale]MCG7255699.1 winged helix DNA-binding protein [Corynebacterium hadale]MCG7265845.1 winged helix DNA-binding protein [Corynebacterium hadale]PAT03388.1 MarR family transcriptional regulator [Corynebacterium sp. NML 150383]PAT11229.1 MarR family transcriptional regulator [Corynebacterium hadale]